MPRIGKLNWHYHHHGLTIVQAITLEYFAGLPIDDPVRDRVDLAQNLNGGLRSPANHAKWRDVLEEVLHQLVVLRLLEATRCGAYCVTELGRSVAQANEVARGDGEILESK